MVWIRSFSDRIQTTERGNRTKTFHHGSYRTNTRVVGRDDDLGEIAAAQHGVISRDDLVAAGFNRRAITRRVDRGLLVALGSNAYLSIGAPLNDHVRALAAVINTPGDSYLSHTSAAWLWEIPGFQVNPINVARRYEGTRWAGDADRVHNLRGVPGSELGEFKGIPVASPTLTLFQVAAVCHPIRTERAVDNAIVMGLTEPARLHSLLMQLAARGRNGIRAMREILAERPPGYRPVESGNERRFLEITRFLGVNVERQIEIGDQHSFITRVDFRDTDRPDLIYRVQSHRWHTAKSHAEDDEVQRLRLEKAGFTVLDVWDRDLWGDRAFVERQILWARGGLTGRSVG